MIVITEFHLFSYYEPQLPSPKGKPYGENPGNDRKQR